MPRQRYGRIEGRRGVELRKRRLAREPLCRLCKDEGRITVATTVDHIIPLASGGEDTDDNCQSLCQMHHSIKTAMEQGQAYGQGASNHPEWIKPSAIPLTIIAGPPASGKTTYMKQRARPGDICIDLDLIQQQIDANYSHWSGDNKQVLNQAIRIRNSILADLSRLTEGQAWLIVHAPTQAERNWWRKQTGGQVVLLDPGMAECVRRAKIRGTTLAVQGIKDWYAQASKPWRSGPKTQIGLDGWPL